MNDFCLIESGEDEKWQGQVSARENQLSRDARRSLSPRDAESLTENIYHRR